MENIDRTDSRLTDLEVKASFTEDMLDKLNQVVVQQQLQIDRLVREVAELRERGPAADDGAFRSLRDELPPHY
ncbi:MAG: SlyX family protein [Burkholderiaceae bacterium]|jgi:SlyX protein